MNPIAENFSRYYLFKIVVLRLEPVSQSPGTFLKHRPLCPTPNFPIQEGLHWGIWCLFIINGQRPHFGNILVLEQISWGEHRGCPVVFQNKQSGSGKKPGFKPGGLPHYLVSPPSLFALILTSLGFLFPILSLVHQYLTIHGAKIDWKSSCN